MSNSEILEALNSLRTHLESQFTATNSTIKACMQLVDSKFTDLLSTSPSPAPASSPAFRSGGSSSAPQQRRLPTAPVQRRGSSNSGIHLLSFDVTSLAAATTSAAASTSFSAAPPPFHSPTIDKGLTIFAPNDETFKDADAPDLSKLSNAEMVSLLQYHAAAASTSIAAALPPSAPVPSPSAVFSQPSSPPSAASPSPSAVAFPPSVADSPLPLGSGAMLNRAGFAAAVVGQFAAPPPFLSSDDTTTLYLTTGNADGKLGFVNIPGSPLPPPPEGTPPPILQFGPQPPPPPPQAHNTRPNPSDTKAQTFLNLVSTPLTQPNNKFKDDAAVASRRGVIFSLYALEEVYKDIFESPP